MHDQKLALSVVESLRKGIPPQQGTGLYSVGNEKLIQGIERHHLSGIEDRGIIRFISGSWGAGKTHFFRLLREVGFEKGCLVSNVELSIDDVPLNKFERVFYSIVRNIMTPSFYHEEILPEAAPFGRVVEESLVFMSSGGHQSIGEISHEQYAKASQVLMGNHGIDIDFKKMIQKYWETYLPESTEPTLQDQVRGEILQWFNGEGAIGDYRKRFNVSKIVRKDNARLMLQSLAAFVRASGYKGLIILFDEAEQSYSIMRKSALKDAQNNLLSLINNIEKIPGLFLLYATTPEFFTHPRYGIVTNGALAGRIGRPEERPPRALDNIWNLDAVKTTLSDYQTAADKIRTIYIRAYPEAEQKLPPGNKLEGFVEELYNLHPSLSSVRFWRILVTALITHFDDHLEEDVRKPADIYKDVMDRLKED